MIFLLQSDMQITLVVFDEKATRMGRSLYPDLEAYIDLNYVQEKRKEEYGGPYYSAPIARKEAAFSDYENAAAPSSASLFAEADEPEPFFGEAGKPGFDEDFAIEEMQRKLNERLKHVSDTFPQYLLYLISQKGMDNTEVYKRAIVDKKVFSKIKNNPDYHPQKLTALCLCIGAKLSMDETRDLLARAGYALSPCDKTDIIFSYFIENGIYDMIELDIQLEEHGLPCIIT